MAAPPIDRRLMAGGAGVTAIALAGGLAAHRALARRIARDPESEALREVAPGDPASVISADGTRLHVETFGPADGPAVLLIHGWTETIGIWVYVTRALTARGMRVVAFDLRGHGRSDRAAGQDYSLRRFGEDVEAVLGHCIPQGAAVVAGHSLGAMSIAAWAEHHPVDERARAALLVNSGVSDLVVESLLMPVPRAARVMGKALAVQGFMGNRAPLPRFATPATHAAIRYAAFGPIASPAQVAFFERMLISTPPGVRAQVGIAISEMDLADALANLTIPTSIIAGRRDRLTPPAHARRIAPMLPQLHRLSILDGVGHMALLERPQNVVQGILELAALSVPDAELRSADGGGPPPLGELSPQPPA